MKNSSLFDGLIFQDYNLTKSDCSYIHLLVLLFAALALSDRNIML